MCSFADVQTLKNGVKGVQIIIIEFFKYFSTIPQELINHIKNN